MNNLTNFTFLFTNKEVKCKRKKMMILNAIVNIKLCNTYKYKACMIFLGINILEKVLKSKNNSEVLCKEKKICVLFRKY